LSGNADAAARNSRIPVTFVKTAVDTFGDSLTAERGRPDNHRMNTPTPLVARLHVDLMRVVAAGCS
jgi:hypothetical protein